MPIRQQNTTPPISTDTVVATWFKPFSLLFSIFWSWVFVRLVETLSSAGELTTVQYFNIFATTVAFFAGFGFYQRYLLRMGNEPNRWLRHTLSCFITWLAMLISTVVNIGALIQLAQEIKPNPTYESVTVLMIGLLTVWMFSGWLAVFWDRVLPQLEREHWSVLDIYSESD